ncbi:MAG TPA: NAD(P)-binding protein [Polyangia bacterium]|jgi:uncharacterized protein with NAD-binding domain and iron-sulfur cluster|nr:NAD(P)-binding protein [Polyangia bacterium]
MSKGRIKVAIVGGGCASITTAFELTRPEHQGRYDVTVYQLGWRIGGKGASGRGPADRIEEHGLHLWMGFYENAFRVMRECYEELGRDPKTHPMATWQDAFAPDPCCGVADKSGNGGWSPWMVHFPPVDGLPGDPGQLHRWTPADYLARCVTLLRSLFEAIRVRVAGAPAAAPASIRVGDAGSLLARLASYTEIAALSGIVEYLNMLDTAVRALPRYPGEQVLKFHDALARAARSQIEAIIDKDDEVRRLWEMVDMTLAVVRGMVRDGLLTDPRGFDAINDLDCREWLMKHGASARSVNGAFVRALYDLAFAYEDGDVARPRIAAGQALRGAVRAFFTYRGAFFWKMQAGMGDVVFAPFYEVLRRRGVRFEFFHRLDNVRLGRTPRTRRSIEALDFSVQARVKGGADYEPLVDVKGLPCWPSEPDWKQLVDGARMRRDGWEFEAHWEKRRAGRRRLRVGRDFDMVVLGVGVAAVPTVARELVAASPKWRKMIENVKSVPTQAFQLWMNADMKQLGWSGPQANISGFVEPFDTWADMRQLIPRESFAAPVKSVAYFCSVLPDPPKRAEVTRKFAASQRAIVRRNAIRFLNKDIAHLWPRATKRAGEFRWDVLVAPSARQPRDTTERRFDTQFLTANVNPSDRYTLSLPGTLEHRISPLDRTFENLTIAGDWTDCSFNEGCVEAAVMSGRLAAHALSGSPRLEDIVGFDHP